MSATPETTPAEDTARPRAPLFTFGLRTITEAAARAAYDWIGRGDKNRGDLAGVEAMRGELNRLPIDGVVVIGEGEKDEAPALYNGEQIGNPAHSVQFDIAVDPVEGTSYLAKGMTNAMAVIAMAPRGTMFEPGPCFYMEKFAGPPAVKGKIDPAAPVSEKLRVLSREIGKPVSELTVYVLEKPRHKRLVEAIYDCGARVALYPAGDVAGALMAAIPDSGVDALMGTGGTPEGIMTACAIRALGGEFLGRMDPQLATERAAVTAAGMDTARWYQTDELVSSDRVFFCATGITTGLLLEGVGRDRFFEKTQTLMVSGVSGERQFLTTYHKRAEAGPAA
ncbi:class II fructose-bisphosphatase [Roseospirillum parvum]|uniref:Fructose-1,6-bisphosphatase n=1 Tax=Roseospirillum parvum TaxID=83401 RepID=A0A1G7UN72_9PROT|nr:class II fructose-bisphosphatase [Roseospirillum parvum]SDG48956.1 fructose-1,6-bisphosphatase II [Roseospirillum parvum]